MMRTYGVHGGEQQLSQLFALPSHSAAQESFAFIYRDSVCALLFAERAPRLVQRVLLQPPAKTGSAWAEFLLLLPRLPILQWRFWRLIMQEKPQVCLAHGFQAALVAWPAVVLHRTTKWVYVHRTTKARTHLAPIFRLIYRPFNAVAGNSQSVTASLAPFTQLSKLVSLDNGIDLARFDERFVAVPAASLPKAAGKVIVSVGRLLPKKGHALLIESFATLVKSHPLISLWIVGDGEERTAVEALIAVYGLTACVHLLGYRRDVPAVLAHADVFVNTSAWEGMSNAVLEGMAARLPSVVVDAPGVTECHISGQTGLVVQRDAIALAKALERVLTEPEEAMRMASAARSHVEARYTMEASRARYDALFSQLVGGSN
jgi:glycosyltransferase involved in cell wall biosynthesis